MLNKYLVRSEIFVTMIYFFILAIKHSCSELGKINYVMNESEQHVFNNKLLVKILLFFLTHFFFFFQFYIFRKIGLNQTICDFSSMIDDLKITGKKKTNFNY
jgi:hypothetical protein